MQKLLFVCMTKIDNFAMTQYKQHFMIILNVRLNWKIVSFNIKFIKKLHMKMLC